MSQTSENDPLTPALPDIEKLYECDECGQRFTREYYVLRHKLAVHTEDKPFKCAQCDRTFSQGQALHRHMVSHTGEKKFVCERCNKTFGFKSNLDRHKRNICYKHELHDPTLQIPGVEKRFKCDLCDKSFSLKSNFERHKRTVCFPELLRQPVIRSPGPGRTHKCDVCQKVFGTPFNLQRHQKAVCYKDEFQDLQPFNLQRHQKAVCYKDEFHNLQNDNGDNGLLFTVKEEMAFVTDGDYNNDSEEFSAQDYQQQYEAIPSAIKKEDESGDITEDYDHVDFNSPAYKTELENEMSHIESAPSSESQKLTDSQSPVTFKTVTGSDGKEKKIYTCDRCNRTFGFRQNLCRHIRTNVCASEPMSTTNDLSVSLIQSNSLTEVQQVYTGVSKVAADLDVHQHLLVQKTVKAPVVSPALKPHKCPKCENRFGTYQALNAHVTFHNKVNPYTCNICERIFIGKKELLRHKKLHTDGEIEEGDKIKNGCSVCGMLFTTEQELANHFVAVHVREAKLFEEMDPESIRIQNVS